MSNDDERVYRHVKIVFKVDASRSESRYAVYEDVRVGIILKEGQLVVELTRDGELVAYLINPEAIEYF